MKKHLREKLLRRYNVKNFVIYYFFIIIIKVILGIVFLNAVYVTRNYIINPDKFWDKTFNNDSLLSLQSYCAFTGIYLICNSIFSIMNNILITIHIYYGGLKRRLQYANIVFIIFQIALFVYSIFTLVKFTNLISLFIILFIFSFFNILTSIIYFMLVKRVLRRENIYMLSIRRMESHALEYYQEYLQKENVKKIYENKD
jgi:Na+/phosphate symporter